MHVALEAAKANGDAEPAFVVYVTATLQAASEALGGEGKSFFPAGEGPGDAGSVVDLVVMGGHFTSDGSRPPGAAAPKGTVLSVTIDSFVEITSLGEKLPSLTALGPVTRLA
ncbi:MAG: hypothetical protein ACLQBB_16095 [Solirubrobacteraceae bacterium]